MIKKITKPDNYNVAYFTPTITREAWKVIKEILVSAKQIGITTTAEATIPE